MSVTIQIRRDTASNWTSANPVLAQGELGVETDTDKAKLGDGTTTWASLAYWPPGGGAGGSSGSGLTDTTVKTSSYTASAGDMVLVSTASSAVTVHTPPSPSNKQIFGVKLVIQGSTSGVPNVVTISANTGATLNDDSSTTIPLALVNQSAVFQYDSSLSAWMKYYGDIPLTGLDGRYAPAGQGGASDWLNVASALYGATGSGRTLLSGAMTASSATLTAAGAGFSSANAGDLITVAGAGLVQPPATPSLAQATTGGTVAAGTYQVMITYVNAAGETTPSPAASVTTTGATSTITVPSPPVSGGCTGWYAYVTQAGGSTYTRQQGSGSPTAIGTSLTLTAPPTSSGAARPGSNTATGAVLSTTISAYVSSTQVTLAATAAAAVSGATIVFGTDDTAAIQSALTAASTGGGGTVYLPGANYMLSSALSLPDNVVMQGAGNGYQWQGSALHAVTLLTQTSPSASGVATLAQNTSNVAIRDIAIAGPGSGTGVGISMPVTGYQVNAYIQLSRVWVSSFGSHGAEIAQMNFSSVRDCAFGYNGGAGLYIDVAGTGAFSNIFSLSNGGDGFTFTGCNSCAFEMLATSANGGNGITFAGGQASAFTACLTEDDGGNGMVVSGSQSITIASQFASQNNNYGLLIAADAFYINILGFFETAESGAVNSLYITNDSITTVSQVSVQTAARYAPTFCIQIGPDTLTVDNLAPRTPLPVSYGGTGGNSAYAALTSLGAAPAASPAFTGTPTAPTASSSTNTTQLATTAFVQTVLSALAQGLQPKPTATATTAAALPANTYSNGAAGVGATLTGNASGVLTVDTHTVAAGDLILVTSEVAAANNGLYTCTTAGASGVPYVLTRHANMNQTGEFSGAFIPSGYVSGGQNSNSLWLCNPAGTVTVGTTAIPLTQLNGATDLIAGSGVTISGNTISAAGGSSGTGLTDTAVKTGAYTAAAGDMVLVSTASAAVTITTPASPANKALFGVKLAIQGSTASVPNIVTVQANSGATFNDDATTTSSLKLPNQSAIFQYDSSLSAWVKIYGDIPLADLDGRYAQTLVPAPSGDTTGVTDSANINAVLSGGATRIVFPAATYILSADILPQSGQTLICHGATFRRAAGSGTAMNLMSIAGTSTALITDVKVYGGTWDGNKAGVTGVTLYNYAQNNGIRVAWARDIRIESATVQNTWSGGFLAGDSVVSGLRISNCLARNGWDNGIFIRPGCIDVIVEGCVSYGSQYHGIDAIRSDLVTFTNCHAWGNGPSASGEGAGFRLEGCRWSQVTGCSAWDNGLLGGLALTDTAEGESGWTWLGAYSDTTTYAAGNAVYWPPAASANELTSWYCIAAPPAGTAPSKQSAYWVPCAFDAQQGAARNGYGIAIRDCRFTSSFGLETIGTWKTGGTYAVNDTVWYYSGSAWSLYVCTTAVTGSSTAPPSDTSHWLLASYNSAGIVVDNQTDVEITGCTTAGGYAGIIVGSGYSTTTGSDEVRITGCDIRDNTGNGIYFAATTAARNFAVSDCRIYGNHDGILMSAAAYLKVSGCQFTGNSNNAIETTSTGAISVDIYDNVFSGTVTQSRAWYEDGTNSTIRAGRNIISGQTVTPYSLSSPTSFIDGTNLINGVITGTWGTANGGTGATTAAGGYNALSPMTTLGDTEYESAAGVASRLPGNTAATKKFYTQTGTGTVSAAPGWNTIAASDLPLDGSGIGGVTLAGLGLGLCSINPAWANADSNANSEQLLIILCTATVSRTVTTLGVLLEQAGATPGAGVNQLAMFSEAGTLLAQTGDMTTAFEAVGFAEGPIANPSSITSYSITEGTNYYLAFLSSFTGTVPKPAGYNTYVSGALNGHYISRYLVSQATMPATITPSTMTNQPFTTCMYAR